MSIVVFLCSEIVFSMRIVTSPVCPTVSLRLADGLGGLTRRSSHRSNLLRTLASRQAVGLRQFASPPTPPQQVLSRFSYPCRLTRCLHLQIGLAHDDFVSRQEPISPCRRDIARVHP